MNKINELRAEILKYFSSKSIINDSKKIFFSPNNNYRLEIIQYKQNKTEVNWIVTRVEIYDNISNKSLFYFYCDSDRFFYSWVIKNNIEYLICAENLCGGQTVVDLINRKLSSYSSGEDGFVSVEYHLSPNKDILGVIGCFWGCPYVIKLYKFTNPLDLPLTEIQEIKLLDNDEIFVEWVGNDAIKLRDKNIKERIVKVL